MSLIRTHDGIYVNVERVDTFEVDRDTNEIVAYMESGDIVLGEYPDAETAQDALDWLMEKCLIVSARQKGGASCVQ